GTGFDEKMLRIIRDRLASRGRETSPFAVGTPTGRGHHWVEPTLVAEVRFTEWTEEGGIRHPAFLGLRDDKPPSECRRGAAGGGAQPLPPPPPRAAPPPPPRPPPAPVVPRDRRPQRDDHESEKGVLAGRWVHEVGPDRLLR